MHINELTKSQLEQEIGQAAKQCDIANCIGDKKTLKKWNAYRLACMTRLKEIDPQPKIDEDELLAELMA